MRKGKVIKMPFVAKHVKSGRRYDITRMNKPQDLRSEDFVCQLCEGPMFVVAGFIRAAHFRHKTKCTSDVKSHPDSPEHRAGKEFVRNWLKEKHPEVYKQARIEFEVKIPEANRLADVVVTFRKKGVREIHEVQLAGITIEELEQRTRDYERAGFQAFWWLGKAANTKTNQDWCLSTIGVCPVLIFETETVESDFETESIKSENS
jgi:competence protein CoiA